MEREVVIKNTKGLHAKLAVQIVQAAQKYDTLVKLYYKDEIVDAESILGLMSLVVPAGENVKVVASGPNAEKVIQDIISILG
jgi:phosphocarrier protein